MLEQRRWIACNHLCSGMCELSKIVLTRTVNCLRQWPHFFKPWRTIPSGSSSKAWSGRLPKHRCALCRRSRANRAFRTKKRLYLLKGRFLIMQMGFAKDRRQAILMRVGERDSVAALHECLQFPDNTGRNYATHGNSHLGQGRASHLPNLCNGACRPSRE